MQDDVEDGPTEDYMDVEEALEVRSAQDNGTFDKLSLSSSLESLLDEHFIEVVRLRRQFKIGWAAAEELHWRSQDLLKSPEILVTEMQHVRFRAIQPTSTQPCFISRNSVKRMRKSNV